MYFSENELLGRHGVSKKRPKWEKVIPAWPKVGKACVVPIHEVVDSQLVADLDDPEHCLLPESEWPSSTPRSKVYASDDEWFRICKAAPEMGMFVPMKESDIFRNQFGDLVTNGAMGVDKPKEVDGVMVQLLRFICILTPINCYMRKFAGDSWSLPQANLLNSTILGPLEAFLVDSRDLESCFNIFYFKEIWRKFFAFSKKVSCAAFGGPANKETYVSIRAVPMGWINSVNPIQNFIRRFVFRTCKVPGELEVNPLQKRVSGDAAITCMDGFDYFSRVKILDAEFKSVEVMGHKASRIMENFEKECDKLGLPLNETKSVFKATCAKILGGEIEGASGCLGYSPEKASDFAATTAVMLSLDAAPQVSYQHWAGTFCFMAGFRRPLFSVAQEIFKFIYEFKEGGSEHRKPSSTVRDEMLIAALLIPMAFSNLRAPMRSTISISDASEEGGAAGEAVKFTSHVGEAAAKEYDDLSLNKAEEWTAEDIAKLGCQVCKKKVDGEEAECPFGCEKRFCSMECFGVHKEVCLFKKIPHLSVAFLGQACKDLPWEFLKLRLNPIVTASNAGDRSLAGLLLWCPSEPERRQFHTRKGRITEQVMAGGFKALHRQLEAGKFMAVLAYEGSAFWKDHRTRELEKFIPVKCTMMKVQKNRGHWEHLWLMHNFEGREAILADKSFPKTFPNDVWPSQLVKSLAFVSRGVLQNWKQRVFPPGSVAQKTWIMDALLHSTKGMAKPGMAAVVSDQVEQVLNSVKKDSEADHMTWILEYVDFKGSEVMLKTGAILDGPRQAVPYPAFVWDWKCIQSYTWAQTQHINVLELLAFFNYVKLHVLSSSHHSARFLHVFDSRVCSCVLSKGRYSSCMLNRILRRITALLLAADLYVLPLWTISGWNFSDSGSRAVKRPPRQNAAGYVVR